LFRQRRHILYKAYRVAENLVFKPKPNAFEEKDLGQLLGDRVPILDVAPVEKKFSDYFTDFDLKKVRLHDTDVLLRLGFRILRGDILSVPRYGIWSFHHGDNLVNRGSPAGAWEVFERAESTGSVLQILRGELDGGTVLCRSWSSTYQYSINYNLHYYYWKTLMFVPRTLQRLHRLGPDQFFCAIARQNQDPAFYSHRLYTKPTNRQTISFLFNHMVLLAKTAWTRFWNVQQWTLFYRIGPGNEPSFSLFQFKKLVPPKDRFWADPCVVAANDRFYIFFEEYPFKTRKGVISMVEMDRNGCCSAAKLILEKPYHLSYPFIFQWEGCYYLIPETSQNRTIELYRATSFPDQWEFVMNLMEDIEAADATIHVKDSRFWLFANVRSCAGASIGDELFLYHSASFPSKEWIAHADNPIISDVRSSRPAGRIFEYKGKLYRPAQYGSYEYGYAININQIVELDDTAYQEKKVSCITPDWERGLACTHTLSIDEGITVVDGLVKRSRFGF
jgi:hypothetical protein